MEVKEAYVNFSRVNSVTRSFMDEFYQLLLKMDNSSNVRIQLQGLNQQAEAFLHSVERTATCPRPAIDVAGARFINLQTIQQLNEYLASIK